MAFPLIPILMAAMKGVGGAAVAKGAGTAVAGKAAATTVATKAPGAVLGKAPAVAAKAGQASRTEIAGTLNQSPKNDMVKGIKDFFFKKGEGGKTKVDEMSEMMKDMNQSNASPAGGQGQQGQQAGERTNGVDRPFVPFEDLALRMTL